ncbi:MAG: ATP-binding protein [Planctomycetales bacterium]
MNELDAHIFGTVEFDWTMHLSSVWDDHRFDVSNLHGDLRGEIVDRITGLQKSSDAKSPLGWFLVGSGGSGKTHLLSHVRREALARRVGFVMVDMTDVRDF